MRFVLAFLALFAFPAFAQDEQIVAGMSQNRVSITATFVGSEILIFGAVKREAPAPDGPLHVAVVVEGPPEAVTVRRKEKRAGIWVNSDAVEVPAAPTFHSVLTSGPLEEVIGTALDARERLSIDNALWSIEDTAEGWAFTDALIRIREGEGLYSVEEGAVKVREDTLFETRVTLPANLTEGSYKARILLTRGGEGVASYATSVQVQKVGIERWLYRLAHERPLIYGVMSLAIAIIAGWAASAVFRIFQRN